MSKITSVPADEKKMLMQVFRRFFTMQCDMNYVKGGAQGWTYSLMPVINKYYDKKEDQIAALKRHMCFINITQEIAPFTVGLVASMEKQNAETPDFDEKTINAIKISLMGPMAGIGDTLFLNVIRVIAAGVAIPLAQEGNILAPIVFLIICNVPNFLCRYYGLFLGYKLGASFIQKIYEQGIMQIVMKACSIVGLTVIGCIVATSVKFSTILSIPVAEGSFAIQEVFDSIFTGILPLSITLFMFYLVRVKKVSVNSLLIGVLLFSVVCVLLGIC